MMLADIPSGARPEHRASPDERRGDRTTASSWSARASGRRVWTEAFFDRYFPDRPSPPSRGGAVVLLFVEKRPTCLTFHCIAEPCWQLLAEVAAAPAAAPAITLDELGEEPSAAAGAPVLTPTSIEGHLTFRAHLSPELAHGRVCRRLICIYCGVCRRTYRALATTNTSSPLPHRESASPARGG